MFAISPILKSLVLSANRRGIIFSQNEGKSFLYMRNIKGPTKDPCGRPLSTHFRGQAFVNADPLTFRKGNSGEISGVFPQYETGEFFEAKFRDQLGRRLC